jgi:CBS domain-containing protein
MELTVRDVMTTRVVCVHMHASFRAMAAALREHRISAFPVLDDQGKVIGVVSEADLLAKAALTSEPEGMPGMIGGLLRHREHEKARGTCAADLMTKPPVTVTPGETLERAARLMYTRKVKRLPVVDADGHLAGIVSRVDLLSVFDRADSDIRHEVVDQVIRCDMLGGPTAIAVTVTEGVVTVEGQVPGAGFGHELMERIRHVPGVVAVRDRLDYPPGPAVTDLAGRADFPPD